MYRFLLSRQWVLLTLVALLLIPAMVQLGFWQLHRHEGRVARNELISNSLDEAPIPMTRLSSPDEAPDPDDRYRPVTAAGSYDDAHEVLVRRRTGPDGSSIGYYVLTPLVQDDGTAVLVNRGWIPDGDEPTQTPEVPAAPGGELAVTGRLMSNETTETTGIKNLGGLPDGMVMMINSEERARDMGRPVVSGYMDLIETSPAPAGEPAQPTVLAPPDHTGIGAHFAYAFQWWLFAAGVPVGWFLLLRRERDDQHAAKRGVPAGPGEEGADISGEDAKAPAVAKS